MSDTADVQANSDGSGEESEYEVFSRNIRKIALIDDENVRFLDFIVFFR